MELNKIMDAEFLDILFEGKNKEYGAYELRKTYNKRITRAMVGMSMLCGIFFLTQIFASDKGKGSHTIPVTDVDLIKLKPDEQVPEPLPVPPPRVEPPQVAVSQFTPPRIVNDEEVIDPPPTVETLDDTQIGLVKQEGSKDEGYVAPKVEVSTGVAEAPKKDLMDYEKLFFKVEKEAKFPGGLEGWKRYLERNLNANVAADDGASAGYYTVKVQFIVDKEGTISEVQAVEVPRACPSCGPEAVKIIKKGPKWEPAVQNDRKVNYQAVQIVTFQVAEE